MLCTFSFSPFSFELDSPPNRLELKSPDPAGNGGGFSLARLGFASFSVLGSSAFEGFLVIVSLGAGTSSSIGFEAVPLPGIGCAFVITGLTYVVGG